MFKICSIGCGPMAISGHGPAFAKYKKDYDDVCLAACCDINEDAAKAFKEQFGFETYYTDYVKMLDEVKPDVVSLLCPVRLTCPLSIDIMKRGYNIIMEKPPGKNKEEILLMKKAAEEAGVNVRTAFNRRYTPLVLKLKELLEKDDGFTAKKRCRCYINTELIKVFCCMTSLIEICINNLLYRFLF